MEFEIVFTLAFFVLGTMFGSFSSVLVHRIREKKPGILMGRSECPKCGHVLSASDLVPLFSYLFSGGKCRYCHSPIPARYPIYEMLYGAAFAIIANWKLTLWGPVPLDGVFAYQLFFLLSSLFVTLVFVVYDVLYMEIPDEIVIPFIGFLLVNLLVNDAFAIPNGWTIVPHFLSITSPSSAWNGLLGSWAIYTFFYVQILVPGGVFAIRRNKWWLLGEILVYYFSSTFHAAKLAFSRSAETEDASSVEWETGDAAAADEEEEPTWWIGFGDLRIAIFMGLVAGVQLALTGLAIAYVVGSIFGIGAILAGKSRKAQIPFGPFLGAGLWIAMLFHPYIYDAVTKLVMKI